MKEMIYGKTPSFEEILNELANNLLNVKEILIELLKNRSLINGNVNTSLLCDHIMNSIIKEVKQ